MTLPTFTSFDDAVALVTEFGQLAVPLFPTA